MAALAYLDTDAFLRLGRAFRDTLLPDCLRKLLLISPITIFEAITQLTLQSSKDVLADIRAIRNCMDARNLPLLPWPSDAIGDFIFGKCSLDPVTLPLVESALNACLFSDSADSLRDPAGKLKEILDDYKVTKLKQFSELVDVYKAAPKREFSSVWANAVANWAGIQLEGNQESEFVSRLSAFCEYEEERVKVAAANPNHIPDKNDVFDSYQLVYLAEPNLHFITCDGGYQKRIKASSQLARIHRVSADEICDSANAEKIIAKVVS